MTLQNSLRSHPEGEKEVRPHKQSVKRKQNLQDGTANGKGNA